MIHLLHHSLFANLFLLFLKSTYLLPSPYDFNSQQQVYSILSALVRPLLTSLKIDGFSIAAITLSLSLIYLLTAFSCTWVPGVI